MPQQTSEQDDGLFDIIVMVASAAVGALLAWGHLRKRLPQRGVRVTVKVRRGSRS